MEYYVFFLRKTYQVKRFFIFFAPMNKAQPSVERHPWAPYVPVGAKYLFLGTFPPQEHRWSMPFYYPNKTNDFWRIMGLLFMGNRDALWNNEQGQFDLDAIRSLLNKEGIALWDTAMAVRRLKGNASDKYLDIVEPIFLEGLLDQYPTIFQVITTGEKATSVIAHQAGIEVPAIGVPVACSVGSHHFTLWRMPSSSRAYPLSLEKKAEMYKKVFA